MKCESLFSEGTLRNLSIQFHLECGYTSLTYYEYNPAKEHFQRAKELSGLEMNMIGALGKRTRFQQNFLAQLILDVKRKEDIQAPEPDSELTLSPTPLASLPKVSTLPLLPSPSLTLGGKSSVILSVTSRGGSPLLNN
ncbi:unnamed protein product [Coregonus sp. 'balchen']|nr:unnamed protein product [Coregonus sp. 'balchen']